MRSIRSLELEEIGYFIIAVVFAAFVVWVIL